MYKVCEATYSDGKLVLSEKVSSDHEGKSLKVIVIDRDGIEFKKGRFFELVKKHAFDLPADYRFDREEANAR